MLMGDFLILWLIQLFIFVLGISIGHAIAILRLRKEENRRRELDIILLEKKEAVLLKGKKIATDLEEVLYKAHVAQEINDIIRKDRPAKS